MALNLNRFLLNLFCILYVFNQYGSQCWLKFSPNLWNSFSHFVPQFFAENCGLIITFTQDVTQAWLKLLFKFATQVVARNLISIVA